jgi:hypothetical protein
MHYFTPAPRGLLLTINGPFSAHFTGFKIQVIGIEFVVFTLLKI